MTVQPVTADPRPRISSQRSLSSAPSRVRPRPSVASAAPSSASIVVEVAVTGPDALEIATRLAGRIRDLVDSASAESGGVDVAASVGLQIGAGSSTQRASKPSLAAVGRPGRAPQPRSSAGGSVPLPAFVAPAPWSTERPETPVATALPPTAPVATAGPTAAPPATPADAVPAAPLQLFPARRVALLDGVPLQLTRREFDLLVFLSDHAGRVFDRPQLLRLVWGHQVICGERTVDVHIRRLRAKVENAGPVISTVRGVGYRLDAAERVAVLHERS